MAVQDTCGFCSIARDDESYLCVMNAVVMKSRTRNAPFSCVHVWKCVSYGSDTCTYVCVCDAYLEAFGLHNPYAHVKRERYAIKSSASRHRWFHWWYFVSKVERGLSMWIRKILGGILHPIKIKSAFELCVSIFGAYQIECEWILREFFLFLNNQDQAHWSAVMRGLSVAVVNGA